MQHIEYFKGIREVALAIAYDNGMINRDTTEDKFLQSVTELIGADGVYFFDLRLLDDWINTLTPEQVDTLAAGEHDDQVALGRTFERPELLDLFDSIFMLQP